MMERFLAGYEEAPLDYSVFSVIIVTLCIVLVVEVLRHMLDVAASGNPFFQTVLELMYRECELDEYICIFSMTNLYSIYSRCFH